MLKLFKKIKELFGAETIIYPELEDFDSEYQLGLWYESNKGLQLSGENNLCDDFAREARELARKDGKYLSLALIYEGSIYGTTIFKTTEDMLDKTVFHVGNLAICKKENTVWYVDLAFKKVIKLCNLASGGKY